MVSWCDVLFYTTELGRLPQEVQVAMRAPDRVYLYNTFNDFGVLFLACLEPMSDDKFSILERFGKVFDQSYTRFQDIQKAEAQARESQIETSLERIRARALAMQTSDEITDVVLVLKEQMEQLNQPELAGCVIHIYPEDSDTFDSWYAFRPPNLKEFLVGAVKFPKRGTSITRQWLDLYHGDKSEYDIKLSTEEYQEWMVLRDKALGQNLQGTGDLTTPYYHMCDFSGGTLITATGVESTADVKDLQRRAAAVFDLAYRRYVDLQKAEAREKEAIQQSSLDRVRAEIASMRTAGDLERITPLIWKELLALNVPFIRCGVFIMDDEQRVIHNYLSTPDGKAIAAFQLSFDIPGFIGDLISHWRDRKIFLDYWDKTAMKNFADMLVRQGIFETPEQYLKTFPRDGFHLHLLPFLQGMLYVGSLAQLGSDELHLLQSLANAFSTAYARYDDFNRLESAKQQIEKTLQELRQAQQQLVQSEKMASLGELTAGIAHEIQNPLNFVNNFSEVSHELLDELKEEISKGNTEEVVSLAEHVIQNLDKILHHGRRADAIVKGMLQHSRGSSGQKEPTDINQLADEYLRLAYHGFRAKDKSFNAAYETNFDSALEKLSIVPQDVGRVLLNLISNAFYAVSQKKGDDRSDYKPSVTVATTRMNGVAEIRIKDNGSGMSESVKEKIFQPFFTTKPTGQGTGLGLSLAYDIITKGHGGTIEVSSEEGEGTEFTICLPIV
jgi:signal transduction histidine kinase